MKILNLTQHKATDEQLEAGVFEPDYKNVVRNILTIEWGDDLRRAAVRLATVAKGHKANKAMIGGAPYLMPFLEEELLKAGVEPLYAFSKRVSQESVEDGDVVKTTVFKHRGFVSAGIRRWQK